MAIDQPVDKSTGHIVPEKRAFQEVVRAFRHQEMGSFEKNSITVRETPIKLSMQCLLFGGRKGESVRFDSNDYCVDTLLGISSTVDPSRADGHRARHRFVPKRSATDAAVELDPR